MLLWLYCAANLLRQASGSIMVGLGNNMSKFAKQGQIPAFPNSAE